jgi:serine/threonine protein kinase
LRSGARIQEALAISMSQQEINTDPVENLETTESKDEFGLFAGSQSIIGRRIQGRWVIVEVLGEGTMSAVYRAEEEATKKIVALKKIHQHLLKNVINLTKFEQRARALIALNHEHISNFYDINITPEKEVFLFCDYFPSENLEELLSKVGHIDTERACKIFKQAATGLEYAHQQKILHRDLKPRSQAISA